jgi:hypothetical protein
VTRKKQAAPRALPRTAVPSAGEPPVVARLVVEIRSDGKRTVARGALEDARLGERASIEVDAGTPYQLVLSLMRALFQMPAFAGSVAHALLPGRAKARATDSRREVDNLRERGSRRRRRYELPR